MALNLKIKYSYVLLFAAVILQTKVTYGQTKIDVDKEIKDATAQYKLMLDNHPDYTRFPQSLNTDGTAKDMPSGWWCSGFFGGSLWYLYEYTHKPVWKLAADKWTMALEKEKYNKSTHDLGFMLYCSAGNGFRLTREKKYKNILLTGAESLSTRFNPAYGVIKSWDEWKGYDYPVIIDNMMNLELLFWASETSKSKRFYNISISHANQTLKNHFRSDFSTYHVICYEKGGKAIAKKTHQGLADSSAWARGQAWGLYGYTVMYRKTHNKIYLSRAEHIARFILNHPNLPADKIPYWDFDAPGEERDASAATVMASALLELSRYSKQSGQLYFRTAEKMLYSLSGTAYKAPIGTNGFFILKHSVGSKPHNSEVDVPLVYADYYYLEALLRYKKILNKQNLSL